MNPRLRREIRSWSITLLLVFAVVISVDAWRTREVPPTAPAFSGVLAAGGRLSLAEFRARHHGGPVALHFFADWCPVCRTEENSISRLVRDQDTPVLAIATQSGNAAAVAMELRARGLEWPTLVDDDGRILAGYGLRGVPAFVVIDADGRVSSVTQGYTSEIGMRARLWLASRGR